MSWHPGNKSHQWTARKLSLLFLHALDEAIEVWEKASSSDGNPLPGKHWHLSEEENSIREKLRSVDVSNTGKSWLEHHDNHMNLFGQTLRLSPLLKNAESLWSIVRLLEFVRHQ